MITMPTSCAMLARPGMSSASNPADRIVFAHQSSTPGSSIHKGSTASRNSAP